ncbi:MAG: hypothetical protein JXB85_03855 [Anaerolineales bacterium]|nr:hypothetical protein [Anaerolineales bacterium]
MKTSLFLGLSILFALSLGSCSGFAPPPTAPLPATATLLPTDMPIPSATPTWTPAPPLETRDPLAALVPEGEPATEWNGIPIMPEAIAGEGDAAGYVFSIDASAEDVQDYYDRVLGGQGYSLLAAGQGSQVGTVMLIYMKGGETVSVSIFSYGDLNLVMLVR